jgi:hypothetical protein
LHRLAHFVSCENSSLSCSGVHHWVTDVQDKGSVYF